MGKEKRRKSKVGDFVYRLIMLILIIIIAVCSVKLGKIFYEYYVGKKAYDSIADIAGAGAENSKLNINWEALEKENSDIVAWLYSKDTVINYPVVQGDNNSFYLTHMFNKEWNGKGTLFVDCEIENPFADFNTIIYGHRMKDGSMFKCLGEYRDTQGYYNEHSVMKLATKEGQYELQIFSVATVPSDSDFYNIYFNSEEEKTEYINKAIAANEIPGYDKDIQVSASDRLVMLSTCTYEFENARLVVWGKLVEKE